MRNYLICLFLVSVVPSIAQPDSIPAVRTFQRHGDVAKPLAVDSPSAAVTEPGDIMLIVDPRVEALMQDYVSRKHVQRGYRVQIFLGDRKTAEDTKRTFLQKYPDIPAYLSWLAPNFRLRVGDLRTRLEAEKLMAELKPLFPGSYIVPDEIEMPKLPEAAR